jgi:hypothetical protein
MRSRERIDTIVCADCVQRWCCRVLRGVRSWCVRDIGHWRHHGQPVPHGLHGGAGDVHGRVCRRRLRAHAIVIV